MNRRKFMIGVVAAAAATSVPSIPLPTDFPTNARLYFEGGRFELVRMVNGLIEWASHQSEAVIGVSIEMDDGRYTLPLERKVHLSAGDILRLSVTVE